MQRAPCSRCFASAKAGRSQTSPATALDLAPLWLLAFDLKKTCHLTMLHLPAATRGDEVVVEPLEPGET